MNHDASTAQAIVISAHGRHVVVETPTGERVHCHTRGKRSEVVVGDHVRWAPSGDQGVIESIVERKNLLHRQDEWRSKSFAANLDQVMILVAVEPSFGDEQLTRSLIAAADAGVHAHILCNKTDLPGANDVLQRLAAYANADVDVTPMAIKADGAQARATLMPLLQGKVTLVIGPSGVGKSSMINLMVPDAEAQIGDLSVALQAGRHTTTATRWYWLADDTTQAVPAHRTALIDTPGFQQFGLHHVSAERLASLMPDIQRHATQCRFYNCTHRHEPGCGVLAARDRGELGDVRLRLYRMLQDEAQESARRHG